MASGDDEVTYEDLVNQYKRELRTHTLTKIDPHFYQLVDGRLRQLKEEYEREHAVASNSPKVMILQDELRNLTRSRDDLYDLREKKIAVTAIIAARGGDPDRGAMTKGELKLYEDLVRVLKEGRRALLKRGERLMEDAGDAAQGERGPPTPPEPLTATPPQAAAAAQREPQAPPATPEQHLPGYEPPPAAAPAPREVVKAVPVNAGVTAPTPASGRVLVHVLQDVAAFKASDLRTYRLTADDVVALPPDAAKALTARGYAEPVTG